LVPNVVRATTSGMKRSPGSVAIATSLRASGGAPREPADGRRRQCTKPPNTSSTSSVSWSTSETVVGGTTGGGVVGVVIGVVIDVVAPGFDVGGGPGGGEPPVVTGVRGEVTTVAPA